MRMDEKDGMRRMDEKDGWFKGLLNRCKSGLYEKNYSLNKNWLKAPVTRILSSVFSGIHP
jgi:hypothetical protein